MPDRLRAGYWRSSSGTLVSPRSDLSESPWLYLLFIAILIADLIWFIYRIAKGWLRLNEGKPMYTDVVAVSAP